MASPVLHSDAARPTPTIAVNPKWILVIAEGRIQGAEGDSALALSSREILDAATTSDRLLDVQSVRFHRTLLPAVLRIHRVGESVTATVAGRDGANLGPIHPQDDHVLLSADWFPVSPDSLGAAREWLSGVANPARLQLADVAALYRGADPAFEICDELEDADFDQILPGSIESDLSPVRLYPYQLNGVRWLVAHSEAGLGGILADEMGLGKTAQTIALLEHERRAGRGPNLVIAPLTLVENWARELRTFGPEIRFYRHIGRDRVRRPTALREVDTVITTYDLATLDRGLLTQVRWNVVATDEAQAYKNPDTQRAGAIRGLPRRVTIALTGTPLENRSLDLWSIADTAESGFLGSRSVFEQIYESDPPFLRNAIRPLLLRREVSEVAQDLPDKISIDVFLEMFESEREAYEELLDELGASRHRTPYSAIQRLRRFSGHPHAEGRLLEQGAMHSSAKLARFMEIAEEIALNGEKFIVFSAFHAVSDLVAGVIRERLGIPVTILDGRVPPNERHDRLDGYAAHLGSAALISSPAVGGVGLNIVAANHVIHYTLEWNPAKEDQATARAWRHGQTRPVAVHRLVYEDAIDEVVDERVAEKRALFDQVVRPVDVDEPHELESLLKAALERRARPRGEETSGDR